MANLILPRQFTQQPQYPVEVNKSLGIETVFLPSVGISLGLEQAVTTFSPGLPDLSTSKNGRQYHVVDSSGIALLPSSGLFQITALTQATIVLCGKSSTLNAYGEFGIFGGLSNNRLGAHVPFTDGTVYWDFGGTTSGTTRLVKAGLTFTDNDIFIFTTGPRGMEIWQNGVLVASNAATPTRTGSATAWGLGGHAVNPTQGTKNSNWWLVANSTKQISHGACKEISRNPWNIFKPRKQVLYFDTAAASGVTGTGSLTTAATTASGTGTLTHKGTGAATIAAVTASGAGTLSHTGTGALTTLAATLAGAGVLTHVGTGDLTTAAVTVSGSGTVTQAGAVTGTGALTISAITASGTGVISHTGTGSLQTSVVTLAGAGVLTHTGTGDLTTGVTTVAGTVTVLGQITGTGALTIGAVTVSGYDVLQVQEQRPAGGGTSSVTSGKRRQKLILVDRIEEVEELLEQVEEIVQQSPKRKAEKKAKKPAQTVEEAPQAAFDWLSYYQAQLDRLRDQQRAISLKRQLDKNAEIIRAILDKQQQEAQNAQIMLQMQQDEEDFMLLLMAA